MGKSMSRRSLFCGIGLLEIVDARARLKEPESGRGRVESAALPQKTSGVRFSRSVDDVKEISRGKSHAASSHRRSAVIELVRCSPARPVLAPVVAEPADCEEKSERRRRSCWLACWIATERIAKGGNANAQTGSAKGGHRGRYGVGRAAAAAYFRQTRRSPTMPGPTSCGGHVIRLLP